MTNFRKLEAVVEEYHRREARTRSQRTVVVSGDVRADPRELRAMAKRKGWGNVRID